MAGGVHRVAHHPAGGDIAQMAGEAVFRLEGGTAQIVHAEGLFFSRGEKSPPLLQMRLEIGAAGAVAGFAADAGMHQRSLLLNRGLDGGMGVASHTAGGFGGADPQGRFDSPSAGVFREECQMRTAVGIVPPGGGGGRVAPFPLFAPMAAHAEFAPLQTEAGLRERLAARCGQVVRTQAASQAGNKSQQEERQPAAPWHNSGRWHATHVPRAWPVGHMRAPNDNGHGTSLRRE